MGFWDFISILSFLELERPNKTRMLSWKEIALLISPFEFHGKKGHTGLEEYGDKYIFIFG